MHEYTFKLQEFQKTCNNIEVQINKKKIKANNNKKMSKLYRVEYKTVRAHKVAESSQDATSSFNFLQILHI